MKKKKPKDYILGAGITGLAASWASRLPVLEAKDSPGGICASYYVKPRTGTQLRERPKNTLAYRFEIGGGHWIFGAKSKTLTFIRSFTPIKSYARKSAVYFSRSNLLVPFPLQNNLRFLNKKTVKKILEEIKIKPQTQPVTMKEWLKGHFGGTLCSLFFFPFHDRYTAGLYKTIAPQDAFKSPLNYSLVIRGTKHTTKPSGYNATFIYPQQGLNVLLNKIAEKCSVAYSKRVIKINPKAKILYFSDKTSLPYKKLVSTIPLNRIIEMTGIKINCRPAPYSSVLVLNIGAIRGPHCPDAHWLYCADNTSGFYRIGFYSNVDSSFLPGSNKNNRVSLYVERAFKGGEKPSARTVKLYAHSVVKELQGWGFITDIEALDSTWVDAAYSWSYPDSDWAQTAKRLLCTHDITPLGRYGEWKFQGIADSINEGLALAENNS